MLLLLLYSEDTRAMTVQSVDTRDTIERSTEMRDFARVVKAAFLMIVRYLERRYGV